MVGEEKTTFAKELVQGQTTSDLFDHMTLHQKRKIATSRVKAMYDVGIDRESFHGEQQILCPVC